MEMGVHILSRTNFVYVSRFENFDTIRLEIHPEEALQWADKVQNEIRPRVEKSS
jgi:hypothetical protein